MKHLVIVSGLVIAVTAVMILGLNAIQLTPQLASEEGRFVDQMFTAQTYVIAFFFSLIMVIMLYSVVVFRRRPGDTSEGPNVKGNTPLEVAWTVIPLIIVMGFGVWGAGHLSEITSSEPDDLIVKVTGFQFGWSFEYPDYGIVSSELYLPVGRQVNFQLTSRDVIHSFWIPEFRIKQDAVPGQWTTLLVTPNEVADFRIRCAELCGYAHSAMYAPVIVVEPDQFEAWVADQEAPVTPPTEMTPAEKGKALVQEQGCQGCHSIDGSVQAGPTWLGLYGRQVDLEDGSTVLADEAYLRNSILDPGSQVVAGFAKIMPAYQGVLSDEDVNAIIEYIKSLDQ